ncbi:MAG: dephospho-CoA kinase, partial [Akkermansiaceae bacterium]|nr:dephospho-CoA kinase [Akkermansiaceae bacterium]
MFLASVAVAYDACGMQVMALTGGIASGKSTLCRLLAEYMPSLVIFDCDAAVRNILGSDAAVMARVVEVFGGQAVGEDGRVDRNFLRDTVFADESARLELEAILHPRVRQECLDSLERAAKRGAELFVADVPLFFEKGFDFGQSKVLVIASSRSTQVKRLKARSGFDDSLIESILAAQLSVQEKISRADVVFWNEGPQSVLRAQVRRFVQALVMTSSTEPNTPESQGSAVAAPPLDLPVSIDINSFRL